MKVHCDGCSEPLDNVGQLTYHEELLMWLCAECEEEQLGHYDDEALDDPRRGQATDLNRKVR